MTILDGKLIAKHVKETVKRRSDKFFETYHRRPTLAVIMIGDDPASKVYVRNTSNAAHECSIDFNEYFFTETAHEEDIINLITHLSQSKTTDGILVQLPIPRNFNTDRILYEITPVKDVDGFNVRHIGAIAQNKNIDRYKTFIPCTPAGIMEILNYYNIDPSGKDVTIVGRSNTVGKPMSLLMLNQNATVTICHSHTKDLKEKCRNADILISCVGKSKLITEDMVKQDAVVIDVGMNRDENNKLCGDVDFSNVASKTSFITPVPGGVGPMTVAMLMKNTMDAAEQWELIKHSSY